ncbi:Hypothetical protein SMAX5B_008375 [Scophthalmus maximus]|uniref:Uncharacterized protein n=1 Tax=Scophthalmus maximus TaxID=52904 RepID=A0A2U9CSI0_SCOMX|nr:Hypothetical protein SMAX5B_008375 [Scophthalmus maximus]
MRRIQPARIWRVEEGFRVDMLGCLIDTLYVWNDSYPEWGGSEGLASIWETLTQLRVHKYVPHAIPEELRKVYCEQVVGSMRGLAGSPSKPRSRINLRSLSWTAPDIHSPTEQRAARSLSEDEQMLRRVYRMCEFSDSDVPTSDTWGILGSECRYKDCSLPIGQNHKVHPYGPFFVRIQNQILKWNRAIVVEPVTSGLTFVGQLNPNSDLTGDMLARALLDTFASNTYPEPPLDSGSGGNSAETDARNCAGGSSPIDTVRETGEILRRAAEIEDSQYYSMYYTS